MVEAVGVKRFEVKKWNAVALWSWGKYNLGQHAEIFSALSA